MAKNDEMIKTLLAKVETQKKDLGDKPRASWRTNGIFKYDQTTHFNLNTVSDSQPLVEALAFMLTKITMLVEACKRLGVSSPEFKWNGYTYDEYVEDFKTRLSIIAWEHKKRLLDDTKNSLSALVSEEARTEMELEKLSKLLG